MRKTLKHLVIGSLLLVGAGACADLEVVNLNEPDAGRSLSTAGDVESLIGGAYNTWFNGIYAYGGPGMFLSNASFQHNAPWSNSGMEQYARLPRVGIQNDIADNYYGNFSRVWFRSYRALAALSDGLKALDDPDIADELGSEAVTRAQAYAKFVQGIGHATIAAMYDRGFVVDETTDLLVAQEPVEYTALMDAAMGYFDDAIALSSSSFTLPFGWMQADITNTELAAIAHSFKARFRAATARTPAERSALNWSAIIADANAGIDEDLLLYYDDYNGWSFDVMGYVSYPGWSQMAYWVYGMADQSGHYQEWLAKDLGSKHYNADDGEPVFIITPDTRFPQGSTIAEQRATTGSYFQMVEADDAGDTWKKPERGVWRWSWYKITRGRNYWFEGVMDQPEIRIAEMDMLRAEGMYRSGDLAGAAALVNTYRTAAGLNETDASGTNTSCVPKLPNGSCGDLWEMIKWEKRMEITGTGIAGAGWWFDSRGWGDLWYESPLQFPIPCGELQVLQMLPCNTYGGPGGEGGAAKSSYSYPFEG
jgi:hypothetical protein